MRYSIINSGNTVFANFFKCFDNGKKIRNCFFDLNLTDLETLFLPHSSYMGSLQEFRIKKV